MTVSMNVTLLDYGMCNMFNVSRAFEHVGANLTVTEEPEVAMRADRLVVPGVGAFADSMAEIHRRGHGDAIRRFLETERPMMGICVGMQVLFEGSEEFTETKGLGILKGWVRAIPDTTSAGEQLRIPHIGWNHLLAPRETNRSWSETILEPFQDLSPAVYFVHSFTAHPDDPSIRLADCDYGGRRVCAAIKRDNLTATQFHPERSGKVGLRILEQFVSS